MRGMKRIKYLIVATAFLPLFVACVDSNYPPIFYTLANEYSTVDERGMGDEAGVVAIVKVDSHYFALTTKLIYRTETGDWVVDTKARKPEYNLVPTPATLGSDAECLSVGVDGAGDLYAGYIEFGSPDKGGLYRTADASDPANISWTRVDDALLNDNRINWIKWVTGTTDRLFVSVTDESGSHNLCYSATPSIDGSYAEVVFSGDDPLGSLPYVDVAWDGVDYWVIVGPYLYSGAPGSLALESEPVANPGRTFNGLLVNSNGDVYVSGLGKDSSSNEANLWMWDGAWNRAQIEDGDEELVSLTKLIEIDRLSPPNDVYVGSVGMGYYLLVGGDIDDVERPLPSDVGRLDEAAVNSFFATPATDPQTLFACTADAGLWRGDWDGAKWEWNQE
jgi:hypothetical protein